MPEPNRSSRPMQMPRTTQGLLLLLLLVCGASAPRSPDGSGTVQISGDLKQWHKVTVTLDGPFADEQDRDPNPFTDYRFAVVFEHESGSPSYVVPGYFAADGSAANSSARSGTKWRAHVSPDKPGLWTYRVSFARGPGLALLSVGDPMDFKGLAPFDGRTGSFAVAPTDKTGRDFRARGRLEYVGKHHLRFAGTGEYFLKAGADAPESLLAYADFDGTRSLKEPGAPGRQGEAIPAGLHRYEPHVKDWRAGDPTWRDGKGKGLIGAFNYLAGKGCNAVSFLPYNVGGDGENVWPFIAPRDKMHYDCSKLDQWQIVFDHAQTLGLYLHFKLQEQENDDDRDGQKPSPAPAALDGGDLGPERKLYCRELIARFGYALALNWNLGEENTQSPEQQRAMAQYIRDVDPCHHHIVVHTFPDWQDRVYSKLIGNQSVLTGASLQNHWDATHRQTLRWVAASAQAGKPWVVANDEQGDASLGVPPDPGYAGFNGQAQEKNGRTYSLHDIRKATLWGNLMAGGAGVEYYFGYTLPQNDLACEDWRSRDQSWDFCRIALDFFRNHRIPFWDMTNADALVGNPNHDNTRYCLAQADSLYLVYLPQGGTTELDLGPASTSYTVTWFNPRVGDPPQPGSVARIKGPGKASLGQPPAQPEADWVVIVRRP